MEKIDENDILAVIQKALDLKGKTITIDSSIDNVEEWDSLGHLGILSALDELFHGKLASVKELAMADSVRKIMQMLESNNLI